MKTNPELRRLSERQESDIALFCRVAILNGHTPSAREIIRVASLDLSETEFEKLWLTSNALRSKYQLNSGFIIQKENGVRHGREKEDKLIQPRQGEKFREKFSRAVTNIKFANKFARWAKKDRNLKALSVAGSTSYLSASVEDDLDLFCITARDSMWIFLTKALIHSRWLKLQERNSPQLCFSYILDEARAEKEFTSVSNGGLFARDALSARVILGQEFYGRLLMRSSWMADYFPNLYREAISSLSAPRIKTRTDIPSRQAPLTFCANSLLYWTVGSYLRVKSYLLNRKLGRLGDRKKQFRLKVGKDHCIFESNRYRELRRIYDELERQIGTQSASPGFEQKAEI